MKFTVLEIAVVLVLLVLLAVWCLRRRPPPDEGFRPGWRRRRWGPGWWRRRWWGGPYAVPLYAAAPLAGWWSTYPTSWPW